MLVRDVMRKAVSVQAEETLEVAALRLKQESWGGNFSLFLAVPFPVIAIAFPCYCL